MVVSSAVLFLLLLPLLPALTTYDWPDVCRNNPFADSATSSDSDDDQGATCTLTFTASLPSPEDEAAFCRHMFSDDLYAATKKDESTLQCQYKRFYKCQPGQVLLFGKCYVLHSTPETYAQAKQTCSKDNGVLASNLDAVLFYLVWLYNPMADGVKSIHVDKETAVYMARGIDEETGKTYSPGYKVNTTAAATPKHSYYCIVDSQRLRSAFLNLCKVMREQFKLPAVFHNGMCFVVSPSVSVAQKRNPDRKRRDSTPNSIKTEVEHLHDECRWSADTDYAAAASTPTKWQGMSEARQSLPRLKGYTYLLTPGFKSTGAFHYYYKPQDIVENLPMTSSTWSKGHPRDAFADEGVESVAMGLETDTSNRMVGVPYYFRGHKVCASGRSAADTSFTDCAKKYGAEWADALRDDGTIMCLTVKIGIPGCSYNDVKNYCRSKDAWVAPIASLEEQNVLNGLLAKSGSRTGGIFIGAQKIEPFTSTGNDAKFYWEFDGSPIVYANWDTNNPRQEWNADSEPNNRWHGGSEPYEKCIYTRQSGLWWDNNCAGPQCDRGKSEGVCAKPLNPDPSRKP